MSQLKDVLAIGLAMLGTKPMEQSMLDDMETKSLNQKQDAYSQSSAIYVGDLKLPYADKEKQKAYMREYAKKRRELFKKLLEESP